MTAICILYAEDDQEDVEVLQEGLREIVPSANIDLKWVKNGQIALDYLHQRGAFTAENAPRPKLILLDLNMPIMGGRETLRNIKSDPELAPIPVIMLTTSDATIDKNSTLKIGAAEFINKPAWYEDMRDVVKTLTKYW